MTVKRNQWHWCGMGRDDLHFRLRLPEALKAKIEAASQQNRRSMTAEMIGRLEASFVGFDELKEANTPEARVKFVRQRLREAEAALAFWEMLE